MGNLHLPRQSSIVIILYSCFFISTVVSPSTHQPNLIKRQTSSALENSLLNPLSPNATNPLAGSNRATNLNPTSSETSSNSSSTPIPTNPTSSSPLIPLLGSSLGIPIPSTNSSSTPTNSTSAPSATSSSSPIPFITTSPSNKSSNSTTPTSSTSPLPTPPSEYTPSSHPTSSKPPANNRSESHASEDKSTFGSTTIKLLAITGGVAAGLFLLWTVIRKWKFRPSKRFANKLEDYDQNMFEPRPPSFTEKRPNEYPSYPAKQIPIRSPSSVPYPSHLSERSHTPHNGPRQSLFSQGHSPYPLHRLSNTSVTKPLPIFESNYRLSLGLSSDISHSYPPSDHPQPKVQ